MGRNKIAIFMPSLRGGGAERIIVNLLISMATHDVDIDLLLVKCEGPYLQQVPKSVRVIDFQASGVLKSLPILVRYLRKEQPKSLLSVMDHCNIVAIWAKIISCVPVSLVVSIHSTITKSVSHNSSAKGKFIPILVKFFYSYANHVVAVSNGVADNINHITKNSLNNIKVIYNPVIIPQLFESAEYLCMNECVRNLSKQFIVGVGRLNEAKDFVTLIKAFYIVSKKTNANLIILGEGEDRDSLEKCIKELNLEDKVFLPGFVENPYSVMKLASVFVLSSKYEGLPTVLIEALALGLPVVATDCECGPREILDIAGAGLLVGVGDVLALADAILTSLEGNNLPCRNPERLNIFTVDYAANKYLELLA